MYPDFVSTLHYRASLWYAQHDQTTQAILHAFKAHKWQWAADLIERLPLLSLTWGVGEHELVLLRQWLKQLPAEIVHARPRLCLACTQMLWAVASQSTLDAWFDAGEARLLASLDRQTSEDACSAMLSPQERESQQNLLGEMLAWRAILQSNQEEGEGQGVLALCQRALPLLSVDNVAVRALVAYARFQAYHYCAGNVEAAVEHGLEAAALAQRAGQLALAISMITMTGMCLVGAGQLCQAQQLCQQAIQQGKMSQELIIPEVSYPALLQAEILHERNELERARTQVREAISRCYQTRSIATLAFLFYGHGILLRISLSSGELEAAYSALQELESIGKSMNRPTYLHHRSVFSTVDQVRLWLAGGELERAVRWAEQLEISAREGTPFACEREQVACVRISLARAQPALALQRLEPVLQRATASQRWGHVIEMRLLEAQAHQMQDEERQALDALWEAVRLAEPEGYIRSFVEEGPTITTLLYKLRKEQSKGGPTPYLDKLLAACVQQGQTQRRQPR